MEYLESLVLSSYKTSLVKIIKNDQILMMGFFVIQCQNIEII